MKMQHTLLLLTATGMLLAPCLSLRASEMDDRIEASARQTYVFKTYLKDDAIQTESKNGAVTLRGSVSDASHKTLAENTVESLPGVKSVDNQLIIKGKSAEEHSDMWIGVKVKTALLFHSNVRGTKTDVNVRDGIVTLTGEAENQAQKDLTTAHAQDVLYVKEVRNEMTVASQPVQSANLPAQPAAKLGEKIDDASITAQVKWSLLSHRSTSAIDTKVETTDGVVLVSGTARNAAEISLVTKLVSDIRGVISVVNKMSIGVPVAVN